MKLKRIENLQIHLFYLILIAFINLGFIIFTYHRAEGILEKEIAEWQDKYQVEKQRGDTCLHNFEVIEPQLEQKIIHLYPYNVVDNEDLKLHQEAGQSAVVK